jgi:hypothetical protein
MTEHPEITEDAREQPQKSQDHPEVILALCSEMGRSVTVHPERGWQTSDSVCQNVGRTLDSISLSSDRKVRPAARGCGAATPGVESGRIKRGRAQQGQAATVVYEGREFNVVRTGKGWVRAAND